MSIARILNGWGEGAVKDKHDIQRTAVHEMWVSIRTGTRTQKAFLGGGMVDTNTNDERYAYAMFPSDQGAQQRDSRILDFGVDRIS